MSEQVIGFISDVMTALSNCTLYSKDHPAILQLCEKAVLTLDSLYADERFSIMILGDSLIYNSEPLTTKSLHANNLAKRLRRKGTEKVVFTKGITAEELKRFIADIAFSENISTSYPHIAAGAVEVGMSTTSPGIQSLMEESRMRVQEVFRGFSRFKNLDMVGLEEVVISFISTLRQETNILNVISPVKTHSEYTHAHTTNVAVLSIYQAESLGLKGEVLHDIGLAGLLHDIGKMFISGDVIHKEGKLEADEWNQMKQHPVYGAKYLSSLVDIPKLALIAAFEHHMRFDGTGYPDTKRKGRKQHLVSQIISISDFFDALRTERSYRKALEVPAIIGLLKEASGREFNPLLVDNFLRALQKVRTQ